MGERWYICRRIRRLFQPESNETFLHAADAEAELYKRCLEHDRALEAEGVDLAKRPSLNTDYRVLSASDLAKGSKGYS